MDVKGGRGSVVSDKPNTRSLHSDKVLQVFGMGPTPSPLLLLLLAPMFKGFDVESVIVVASACQWQTRC